MLRSGSTGEPRTRQKPPEISWPDWPVASPAPPSWRLGCVCCRRVRDVGAWLPMLSVGTIAGALVALDNALDLDLTSFLYPVWQACVAVGLATALRRTRHS